MEASKSVIILGSSRSQGNTRAVATLLASELNCGIIDLKEKNIKSFDYENINSDDDFIPLLSKIVDQYELLIFATPVYWYSMSGIMKNFLDRFSDCLKFEKELGQKLKGKSLAVISCGYDKKTVSGFHEPFEYSAKYLGIKYAGFLHTWMMDDAPIDPAVRSDVLRFGKKLEGN